MQIVIDIPEEVYKKAKETHDVMCDSVWLGIKYGTPLPKGHGRLIDCKELAVTPIDITDLPVDRCLMVYLAEDVDGATTILEADKTDSEDKDD